MPIGLSFEDVSETLILGDETPLFEISTSHDRSSPDALQISSRDFGNVERTNDGDTITLAFSEPPAKWGGRIAVTVTLQPTGREVLTGLRIESDSYLPVQRLRFPIVRYKDIRDYDHLLLSTDTGELIQNPRAIINSRYGGEIVFRYPAKLAMQYAALFNSKRSVYFTSYNTGYESFDQRVKSSGGIIFSIDWYPFIEQGEKWESPPCAYGILNGDWHSAADLYREHMAPQLKPSQLPEWMRESFHGWLQISLKGGNNPPAVPFKNIPDRFAIVEELGLNTLHIFSWCRRGMDKEYPLRIPSDYLGPPSDLRDAMDWIRGRGGHATLYTNMRLIDPNTTFVHDQGGDRAYCLQENGMPYIERYNIINFRVACPFSEIYQNAFLEVFNRMITEYHALGAQIDQVSCNPGNLCFSTEHGHPTPATNFLSGYERVLTRIRNLHRKLDPDFFIWSEGCHERLGQWYDVNQGHGEEHSWTSDLCMPEQFHYTFPDFLTTGASDGIDELCHSYGQGKPFDFHEGRLRNPVYIDLFKKLVVARKSEPEYFLRGRFTDSVGLTVATEGVRYWGIQRPEGKPGTLVNLWYRGSAVTDSNSALVKNPHPGWPIRLSYPPDLKAQPQGEWFALEWTGPVATVVFQPEEVE